MIRRRGTCRWVFSNLRKKRTAAGRFPSRLHEDVQDVTVLIHGAPQLLLATLESDVKRPRFSWTRIKGDPMSKEVGEMVRSRDVVQAEGSARTEGARRATGVRADGAAAGAGALAPGQRWSASRKRDVVLRLLRGESLEALSREAGVEIYRLDAWAERAMAGLELGLKDRHGEPVAEVLDAAKRHIGELSMEIELLRERARAAEQRLPLAMRRSRR